MQNCACNFQLFLDRLVWIGRRADGDLLSCLNPAKFLAQQVSRMLLGINLLLELNAVAHFHELMCVTRIAIFAGEFAPAIWIDRPGKGHLPPADASVQEGTHWVGEVFDVVAFAHTLPLRGEACNAHQSWAGFRKQSERSHNSRFAFSSLL